jgi:sporulation protein YlmC with PRC-barrel domain
MANSIWLSEMYGKEIITNSGRKLGKVEDLIVDFEKGSVSSVLLVNADELIRSENTARQLAKNSVKYERVKNVDNTIIVSEELRPANSSN